MGLWDAYLCVSLWPLPRFWSSGKDHRTGASDLVTRCSSQLHESLASPGCVPRTPLESPTSWNCSRRQLPVAGDRKSTRVEPAKSHTSLRPRGQAHGLRVPVRRGDSKQLAPCGAAPMCLGPGCQGHPPPHGRGPLSLLSRPTSCLCFFQCFVVMVKCTSCKFHHLNRMHVSVLSISM